MKKWFSILFIFLLSITLKAANPSDSAEDPVQHETQPIQNDASSDEELKRLRKAAEMNTPALQDNTQPTEQTVYQSGALSLQALNPEISVVGDFICWAGDTEGVTKEYSSDYRVLGIHFESYLDPYSKIKATVPVTKDTTVLGEGYFTRYDILKNVNLTLGKFHQQFGIINRWHDPSLDQVELPLAPRNIFGGHLNQTGGSLEWMIPQKGNLAQEVVIQVTNGDNSRLFGGNTENKPSILGRYKCYFDCSKDTYFELGLSGLMGCNNEWKISQPDGATRIEDESLSTKVFGADITLLWEPTDAMRYQNFVWRSEFYYLDKEIITPNNSGKDALNPWGFYTYFQQKFTRTIEGGLRYDYYIPDTKAYAGASLSPLAVAIDDPHQWQISPYMTWWQSPWVKWRIEYDYRDGKGLPDDNRFLLQCTVSAGPHKHERY